MKSRIATEADILKEVISPADGDLAPDIARTVLGWKFTPRAIKHIETLAKRNQGGVITDAEAEELNNYLRVGSLINLMQAKAHLSLRNAAADAT